MRQLSFASLFVLLFVAQQNIQHSNRMFFLLPLKRFRLSFYFCSTHYFIAFHSIWLRIVNVLHAKYLQVNFAIPGIGCCFITVIYATLLNIPYNRRSTNLKRKTILKMHVLRTRQLNVFCLCVFLMKHFVDLYLIFCLHVALDIMCILYIWVWAGCFGLQRSLSACISGSILIHDKNYCFSAERSRNP